MSFLPDSAPFNEEQRAWLNGFFAGLTGISTTGSGASLGLPGGAATLTADPEPPIESEDDFPWHDASLPIVDRMQMAEGKPLPRRLMAAMAQLDCGSCGYLCQSYSEAIASGAEKNLTLCSPGGKETKQMIKRLLSESESNEGIAGSSSVTNGHTASNGATASGLSVSWSRKNPFSARLIESRRLNGPGSAKDTRHVVIDLSGSGLTYHVGDALGICPVNCDELASAIVSQLGVDGKLRVTSPLGNEKPLLEALCEDCCLKEPSDELIELLMSRLSDPQTKSTLSEMLEQGVPDGFDVLDALSLASGATVTATEVMEALGPLNPRLYSIASSQKQVGDQVHLTVGKVTYRRDERLRKGVASTMLAERVPPGESVRVFVQPNQAGFTVPVDPATPMIMIGPGTGIAPFVAFLQERSATGASGENWLFFGDQHAACDFLYEDELLTYQKSGLLTRLDLAFSRDGDAKVYVQDRMRENSADLWEWLQRGAVFYVCGDASRMAKDVDRALVDIVAKSASMTQDEAVAFVKDLSANGRYHRDVY